MRIMATSDLHGNLEGLDPKGADVVVLAGDIAPLKGRGPWHINDQSLLCGHIHTGRNRRASGAATHRDAAKPSGLSVAKGFRESRAGDRQLSHGMDRAGEWAIAHK